MNPDYLRRKKLNSPPITNKETTATEFLTYASALLIPTAASLYLDLTHSYFVFLANLVGLSLIIFFSKGNYKSSNSRTILATFLCVISTFAVLSCSSSLFGASESNPFIPGGDGQEYLRLGRILAPVIFDFKALQASIEDLRINYQGYPLLLALAFRLLGDSLIVGTILNTLFILSTAILISRTTAIMAGERAAYFATLLFSLTPYMIAQATILQKDAVIIFAMSALIYGTAAFAYARDSNRFIALMFIFMAVAIIGATRLSMLFIFPLFYICLLYPKSGGRRSITALVLVFLATIAAIATLQNTFAFLSLGGVDGAYERSAGIVLDSSAWLDKIDSNSSGVVRMITSRFRNASLLTRFLGLPLFVLVQFSIPFSFWSNQFLADHIWYFTTQQLALVWLCFTGPFLAYSSTQAVKTLSLPICSFFLAGILCYCSIAFSFFGVLPRYSCPTLVFMFPFAGALMAAGKNSASIRRGLSTFFIQYYVIGGLLVFAYFLRRI